MSPSLFLRPLLGIPALVFVILVALPCAWTTASNMRMSLRPVASANIWERRNRVHAGDSAFVRTVAPLMRAAATAVEPRQLTLVSEQAGMVTYYLQQQALAAGHPFHFIDQLGLACGEL